MVKPRVGAPAPIIADHLAGNDDVARPQMRRQPAGDAETDETFRVSGRSLDELRGTAGGAAPANKPETRGARGAGPPGEAAGARPASAPAAFGPPPPRPDSGAV